MLWCDDSLYVFVFLSVPSSYTEVKNCLLCGSFCQPVTRSGLSSAMEVETDPG